MTKAEFDVAIDYLKDGLDRKMDGRQESVYFDLLGDLPAAALQVAVQRYLLEAKDTFLPPPGKLRNLAVEALMGDNAPPSAGEALEQVRKWIGMIRSSGSGRTPSGELMTCREWGLSKLHPCVRKALEMIGISSVGLDGNYGATWRAQFRDIYQDCVAKVERIIRLPSPVVKQLLAIKQTNWRPDYSAVALPDPVVQTLASCQAKPPVEVPRLDFNVPEKPNA